MQLLLNEPVIDLINMRELIRQCETLPEQIVFKITHRAGNCAQVLAEKVCLITKGAMAELAH